MVILGYPGVQALDLVGPFEVFTGATICLAGQGRTGEGYSVSVVTRDGEPATTLTGL
ncbi:MAG TPA: GlxA family transcriptional regulator, partial [Mycobacterium sp.]